MPVDLQASARDGGQHLLVAAGEPDTAALIAATLELAGYRIGRADTGPDVARRLGERPYQLVVVDVELPGLADLARAGAVAYRPPVLLLTGCDALPRLVPALGAGERDCVTKPVRIAEVLARVKVLLRAAPSGASGAFGGSGRRGGVLHYADLVLDDTTCRAGRGSRALDLSPAEYRLLRHLLVNAHKVLSKEQISRCVCGASSAARTPSSNLSPEPGAKWTGTSPR